MRLLRLSSFLLVLAAAPSFAGVIYQVSIDTSSLKAGTTGFIDLAFNGGYPATAIVDNFSNVGGSLNAATIFTQGTVSGSLPGTLAMGDDNADYDEGIAFGSSVNFRLTLAGVPSGTTGNVFTLSFYNSDFTGGLLTGNVNDLWIAQFQMDTTGNITPTAYANPSGGPSFATIAVATPEPVTGLLALAGLAAFILRRVSASAAIARQ